jgi:hypothetical protein
VNSEFSKLLEVPERHLEVIASTLNKVLISKRLAKDVPVVYAGLSFIFCLVNYLATLRAMQDVLSLRNT